MASNVSLASNAGDGNTQVAPCDAIVRLPITIPKQWYKGTGMQIRVSYKKISWIISICVKLSNYLFIGLKYLSDNFSMCRFIIIQKQSSTKNEITCVIKCTHTAPSNSSQAI